jgi:hypothetical protein
LIREPKTKAASRGFDHVRSKCSACLIDDLLQRSFYHTAVVGRRVASASANADACSIVLVYVFWFPPPFWPKPNATRLDITRSANRHAIAPSASG